jgi:hypothetical protein
MAQRRSGDPHRDRIDALYREPSSNFIAARNSLASALKREGDAEAAEAVKRLAKPSPGAWALNQVYWRERPLFDRMIKAGDTLRTLQQRMLAGKSASPRDAMTERQSAVHAVVERAAGFLREDGNQVTAATRQRLATSADALASYGSAGDYVPGRLAEDIDAPGFAALATLGGAAGLRLVHSTPEPKSAPAKPQRDTAPPSRMKGAPAPDPKAERQADREREAAARRQAAERAKAIRAAEQALRDAARELDTVRQRAERARAAAEAAAQEQQAAEEQLARVTARRRAADAAAVAAAESVAAAERGRRDAEAALAAARDQSATRS